MKKTFPLTLLICLALVAASCGESADPGANLDTQDTTSNTLTLTRETSEPTAADSVLPDVDLIRVSTGETVRLSSLTPAETPLLLWFWAPH